MQQFRLLAVILSALALSVAQAADPVIIKLSHVLASATPKGKAADKFKELAELYTRGAVRVEVYPNSQLYKDREEMEALQLGAVQMLAPSLSKFGPMGVRDFEVYDLPYMFPNKTTLYRVMDGDIGTRLFAGLEAKGIKGLAYWDNGFKQMSANKPLRTVEDFKGLKLRIQSSKVLDAQMRALGATPQVMAFSGVYAALQQGVVDGTENPLSNLHTQKMHEVQKHLTLSDHGYLGYAVIVNKTFWDGLKPDIRAALEKAMKESTAFERRIAQEENDDALAKVRAAGTTEVFILSNEGRRAWQQILLPVHEQFADVVGKDTIQSIYKIAAQVEKENQARQPAVKKPVSQKR
jgi:C4-dicarboxylate-binding protein DctP